MIHSVLASAAVLLAEGVLPQSSASPAYGPAAPWVETLPIPAAGAASLTKPAAEVLLLNEQLRLTAAADETFLETAIRINSPEGLAQANSLIAAWNPLTQSIAIHRAQIIRNGRVIDLLAGGKTFTVLRRENNLEAAMIDGSLTATLQPEGLQVGDVLDFALTLKQHDPALTDHSDAALVLAHAGVVKRMFIKASWPLDHPVQTWKSDDLGPLTPRDKAGWQTVGYDLTDAVSVNPPEGAPLRDRLRGVVEFTSFKDWPELSRTAYRLYDAASVVSGGSSLTSEIARLRASGPDAKSRALAALELVEEKVRYFYVGLDAGGLVPAPADQTWARRFGDCKGKTALLLALLHGLGIEAEAVLVSTQAGDGLGRRLPQMSAFDHVLIRAHIDKRPYWLDATRLGDENLDLLRTPNMHWALALRPTGAELEPLTPEALTTPDTDKTLDLDLRAGIDLPAKVHLETVFRGDTALGMSLILKQASAADADTLLRKAVENDLSWVKAAKVAFAYDPKTGVGRLTMEGSGLAPFTGEAGKKEWWVDLSSVGWNADFRRDTPYHADAPFAVAYPQFQRATVTAALPAGSFTLGNGGPLLRTIAGVSYDRVAALSNGQMTMTVSSRAVGPDFPAADAPEAQRALHELSLHDVVLEQTPPTPAKPSDAAAPEASAAGLTPRQRAMQAFLDNDYARAEAEFGRAIAAEPASASLHYDRGAARLARGETELAQADFQAALALDPKDAYVQFALGRLALAKGDLATARSRFKSAVDTASDAQGMRLRAAWILDQADHPADAALAYQAWIAAEADKSKRTQVLNDACWGWARAGTQLAEAKADCDQALAADPDFAAALDSRGLVDLRMGAFAASIADYDRALAEGPSSAKSLFGKGLAELKAGRRAEAEKDLAAARAADPKIDARFAAWGLSP